MDRSDVITLVAETITQDSLLQDVVNEAPRDVFCDVRSIDGNEFLRAGQMGIKPRYRVTMFKYDYAGETTVIYKDQRYDVYRTYEGRNDEIDLYLETKAGITIGQGD